MRDSCIVPADRRIGAFKIKRRASAVFRVAIRRCFAFTVSTSLRLLVPKGGADNVVIRLSFVRLARVGDMVVTDKLNRLIAHDASIECDWRARASVLVSFPRRKIAVAL